MLLMLSVSTKHEEPQLIVPLRQQSPCAVGVQLSTLETDGTLGAYGLQDAYSQNLLDHQLILVLSSCIKNKQPFPHEKNVDLDFQQCEA